MTVVLIKTSSVFSLIGRPQLDNVAASLSSFRNDDGDGNENFKTAIAKQFARTPRFFVHFFAVTSRLQHENA